MILLVIDTPGGEPKDNTLALVPPYLLEDVPLDAINGKMLNRDDDLEDELGDHIVRLYMRLGLESQKPMAEEEEKTYAKQVPGWRPPPKNVPVDLAKYLNPKLPCMVSKVVRIGWAI